MMNGFQYHAFIDFKEVEDYDGLYSEVNAFLNGRGVPSIESAIQQILVKEVHVAMKKNYNAQLLNDFFVTETLVKNIDLYKENYKEFLMALKDYTGVTKSLSTSEQEFSKTLDNYIFIMTNKLKNKDLSLIQEKFEKLSEDPESKLIFFTWLLLHGTGKVFTRDNWEERSRSVIKEMFLNKLVNEMSHQLKIKDENQINDILLIITEHQSWFEKFQESNDDLKEMVKIFLSDFNIRSFININRYNGILWFNKESLEMLMDWMEFLGCLNVLKNSYPSLDKIKSDLDEMYELIASVNLAAENSEYKLEKFLEMLK